MNLDSKFNMLFSSRNKRLDTNQIDKNKLYQQMIGLFIYFCIIVVSIPYYLYENKYFTILEAYLPNVDLIATLFNKRFDGPGLDIFYDLYNPHAKTDFGIFSTLFINYFALLGVTYIIARETKLTGKILRGWSIGFIMLIVTYLVPSALLDDLWKDIYRKFDKNKNIRKLNKKIKKIFKKVNLNLNWLLTFVIGIIIVICIIAFEKVLIKLFRENITTILKKIKNLL